MISKEEVQNLAELARLQLSDDEVVTLQKDISKILDYVGQVDAVQGGTSLSKSEEPPFTFNHNVMREDVPRVADDLMAGKRESLLKALPKREGDYTVVRKIIQKDE